MLETKNVYFETEIEMKKLSKELEEVRMKYMVAHKENLKYKE